MRFMVLVKATKESEAGVLPSPELLAKMGKFNQTLLDAGAMLAGEGLVATSKGARIEYAGRDRHVTDGPFPFSSELIAGFWLIKANSKDEVIDWLLRCPLEAGEVEVRQVFDVRDVMPNDVVRLRHSSSSTNQ